MWEQFRNELQDGVEALKKDWKEIRSNIKNADLSEFKEYEKKDLVHSKKSYTASLQKVMKLTALLCSDYYCGTKLAICKLERALCGLEDSINDLHKRAVKGNAEIEEKLFDTAVQNISAAYLHLTSSIAGSRRLPRGAKPWTLLCMSALFSLTAKSGLGDT